MSLERIGVPNTLDGRRDLYTSVVSVTNPNSGVDYLMHFKEALILEGKTVSEWKDEDFQRLVNIAHYLSNWGMIQPKDPLPEFFESTRCRILRNSELSEWNVIKKYSVNYTKVSRLFPQ
jgi:hypothetical protein